MNYQIISKLDNCPYNFIFNDTVSAIQFASCMLGLNPNEYTVREIHE